jgi:hypothetical protein
LGIIDSSVTDILPDYKIDKKLKTIINYSSITLSNLQHSSINKMIKYINLGNYFGDQYHVCLEDQKKTTEYWIDTFYSSNYKKSKEVLSSLVSHTIKENNISTV